MRQLHEGGAVVICEYKGGRKVRTIKRCKNRLEDTVQKAKEHLREIEGKPQKEKNRYINCMSAYIVLQEKPTLVPKFLWDKVKDKYLTQLNELEKLPERS